MLHLTITLIWNNFNIDFLQEKPRVSVKKFVKIGRPGYKGIKLNVAIT